MANLSRRLLLQAFPLIGATAALPTVAAPIESSAEFVAIPRKAHEAIMAWADAHRSSIAATNAYSDFARNIGIRRQSGGEAITPDEKAESDVLFHRHVETFKAVAPAREKMLMALLRATRGVSNV